MSRIILFQVFQAFRKKTNVVKLEFERDQSVSLKRCKELRVHGHYDKELKTLQRQLDALVSVKADNERFKKFKFICHKPETATAHALFKVN